MVKSIIQKNKQKQNINIKIHVGDKGKSKNKKYKRKPADRNGVSSYNPYIQPYNPVYIQSGYPENNINNNVSNALIEAIKGINNKPIEYYNNPLKREYNEGIQKQEETVNKPFKNDFYRDYDETQGYIPTENLTEDDYTFKLSREKKQPETPNLNYENIYKGENMTPFNNKDFAKLIAEEAQKKRDEMINNGGGFTDNPIKYNNTQKPNETEEDYQKRMLKNQKSREKYREKKNKQKTQIINEDEGFN